jgi:hypothetical protein
MVRLFDGLRNGDYWKISKIRTSPLNWVGDAINNGVANTVRDPVSK